jgi:hypothetical protein
MGTLLENLINATSRCSPSFLKATSFISRFKYKRKISAEEMKELIAGFTGESVNYTVSRSCPISVMRTGNTYYIRHDEPGRMDPYHHARVIFVHESMPRDIIKWLRSKTDRLFIVCDREIKRRPRKTKKSFATKMLFSTKEGMLKADERRFIKIEPENAEKFLTALNSDAKPSKRLLDAIEQAKKASS